MMIQSLRFDTIASFDLLNIINGSFYDVGTYFNKKIEKIVDSLLTVAGIVALHF